MGMSDLLLSSPLSSPLCQTLPKEPVMSSWDAYLPNLMAVDRDGNAISQEAAIVGRESGSESVWTANGSLKMITAEEIKKLVGDEGALFTSGFTVGGVRCTMLRNLLKDDSAKCMDIRTKATPPETETYNIGVYRTGQALVLVKGLAGVHGGKLNIRAEEVGKYLESAGY